MFGLVGSKRRSLGRASGTHVSSQDVHENRSELHELDLSLLFI